ncbi:MAG TPA: primosomal protein N' [Rhodospirillaceae bacterium]|nr:primosomal protein N' [Rhodospirillaceae bacterium]
MSRLKQAGLFNFKTDDKTAACLSVLVPYPVDKAYDYIVPEGIALSIGDYVTVPLGNRQIPGVVWGGAEGGVPAKKLKAVVFPHNLPPMPEVQRKFLDWVAHYTMSARGAVLKMSLSVPKALEEAKPVKAYKIASGANAEKVKGLSPQRRRVLEVMGDGHPRRSSEIAEAAGCGVAVIKSMESAGLIVAEEIRSAAPCRAPDPDLPGPMLSQAQREAVAAIDAYAAARSKGAVLIDGVTGAGKTEVYFESVARALHDGKQVLILLPEIALSNAFLDRFKARFGCAPALWHSHLSPGQRRRTWRGVAEGQTKVVVGARSALFLPFADLGLIIVDEEHDPAYKQEEGVIYHARDMAVVRAHLGKIPIILVSATPSLETMQNVWEGRYAHVHLPDRFGGARLPDVEMIDMRADKPERQHFISPTLNKAIEETLQNGEQALLFLNRRGYAPLTLCRSCGHRMDCPRCTAWLVEHKQSGRLHCHHCGFEAMQPKTCPECGAADSFAVCGPGVERILEEVKRTFPEARTMMLASDTADNNEKLGKMLSDIRDHKVDIIVGTQIIAKGHHFPGLTLVGVIDADLGLQGGELRAAERTYQLLHQVAGRAGREGKKGKVYLQSFMPEHRIMKALSSEGEREGRDDFLKVEALERKAAHMPPFARLAGIIVSGREEAQVIEVAKALGRTAPQGASKDRQSIQTFGPAPAPFARLRGRYRYRLLVRADKKVDLQKTLAAWIESVKTPSTVRVQIDIDPQSFL